jgi:hypothetical protein
MIDTLLAEVENRKASKFRCLQEKNLLVQLEGTSDVTSQRLNSHVGYFHGTAIVFVIEWIHPFNDLK